MKPSARPVYLSPLRSHLPLPGWVSILHRLSGLALFVAVPLGVWALSVSLAGPHGYARVADGFSHPLVRLLLLGLVWAFAHHLFAGVRHLAMDAHYGLALRPARMTSLAVLLAGALVTLAAAWRLFA